MHLAGGVEWGGDIRGQLDPEWSCRDESVMNKENHLKRTIETEPGSSVSHRYGEPGQVERH